MKIVFLGTPQFAVNVLEGLNEKYEIALVISQPNRVKKKGVFIDTPVAQKAHELGLSVIQPESIKDAYETLSSLGATVMVTAAYGQYIPSKILNLFEHRINVHGSLLPRHRGGAPIQRAIMEGDSKTGVTIMEMARKLDSGKMYSKVEYEIKDTDNNSTVFEALSILGRDLLLDSIEDIVSGKNMGVEQDESLVTYSQNIQPEEEVISLNRTSKEIVNQIRGLAMEPGAYLVVKDIKLKVYQASCVSYLGKEAPGTVLNTKKQILIKTLDGAISLDSVLVPGKKITSGKDFANGQKIFVVGDIIS